jgi:hypothetical protein
VRLFDDSSGVVRYIDNAPLVLGLFGTDDCHRDETARQGLERLRQRLAEAKLTELGFAVNEENPAWVLLIGEDVSRFQTAAGRTLRTELLKIALEDTLSWAWQDGSEPVRETSMAGRWV